jgi:perosamine synthetase
MRTILVTGGTGLVGRALFDIINDTHETNETNETNDTDKQQHEWHFIGSKDCDLRNPDMTNAVFEKYKPWAVIHLAGIVLGALSSQDEQWNSWLSNSKIHINVFEACKEYKVTRLLSCSSIVVLNSVASTTNSTEPHYGYIQSKKLLQSGMVQLRQSGITECLLYCPTNIFGYQDLQTSCRLIPSLFRQLLETKKDDVLELNFAANEQKQLLYNYDFARMIKKDVLNTSINLNELPFPSLVVPPEKIEMADLISVMQNEMRTKPKYVLFKKPPKDTPKDTKVAEKDPWTPFAVAFAQSFKRYAMEQDHKKQVIQQRPISLGEFVNTPEITNRVTSVLRSGRLSYGDESRKFERDFAKLHDCNYAVLSNSGTSSLQVALAAMKELYQWQDGDFILVPAITFVASINTILQNNLVPILVDVEKDFYGIDPDKLVRAIKKHQNEKHAGQIRAVMVVHLFGQPCDMTEISAICCDYFLRIIEDSCETMLAKDKNHVVGTFGDIACFSTYVAHLLVTGVGGIGVTNNKDLALLMRSYVNHGRNNIYMTIDDDDEKNPKLKEVIDKRFEFQRIGYSYRITELEAAIANADLPNLGPRIKKRQENAEFLIQQFKKHSLDQYLQLPQTRQGSDHVFMMFPLVLKDSAKFTKEELILHLEHAKIETRNLMPITNQPVYTNMSWNKDPAIHFPVAESLNHNGFYIGCHCFLEKSDLDYVVQQFVKFFQESEV